MNVKKRPIWIIVVCLVIASLLLTACGAPAQTAVPQEQLPTVAATSTAPNGKVISNNGVEFIVPAELGTDASGAIIPQIVENSPAESPAYLEFTLQGYSPTREYFKPRVRMYAVQTFAEYGWGQIVLEKLRAILANPVANANPDANAMPSADKTSKVLTAAGLKPLSLAGVNGVRMFVVLGGGQVPGEPATGDHVMYQFLGLTADGQYYVEVLLPVAVSFLAQDSGSAVPADGVALNMAPGTFDQGVYDAYLKQVADRLNAAEAANTFSPSVSALDAFVQSLKVNSSAVMLPAPLPTAVAEQPATLPPTIPTVTACNDSAKLDSEDPQDGAKFKADEAFRKTWNLINTGTCTWDASYQLVFVDGEQMASSNHIKPLVSNAITPGGSLPIYIDMQAPSKSGEHVGKWSWTDGAGKVVPVTFAGIASSVVTVKITTKQANNGGTGAITNVAVSIVQEQGSGTVCTSATTYFVYVDITADGATTASYRIDLTDASGQVADGIFDGFGSPEAQGSLTFADAGKQSVNLRVVGPYGDPKTITVRAYVNGQNSPAITVVCQ